jgi:hypothetical protein
MDPNLWKKLASCMTGPQKSEILSDIQKKRLQHYQQWKIIKNCNYPTSKALKAQSEAEVFNLWMMIGKFCDFGQSIANNLNFMTHAGFEQCYHSHVITKIPDNEMQIKQLHTLFQNIDEAICNEQKGNFELARLAYKKAQVQMRKAASYGTFDKKISQLCLNIESHLKEIDTIWECMVAFQSCHKPNPLFQINRNSDIFYTLMMRNYHHWDVLRSDLSTPKEVNYHSSKFFMGAETMVKAVKDVLMIPTICFSLCPFSVKQAQFEQWYIPEVDRPPMKNTGWAFHLFEKICSFVSEGYDYSFTEVNEKTSRMYSLNRQKYSTLTKLNRATFGLALPPQAFNAKANEESKYVDDIVADTKFGG